MSTENVPFDVNESILNHISQLKTWFPKHAVISVGEYSSQILLKGSFLIKTDDNLLLFIDKSDDAEIKWKESPLDKYNMLMIGARIDTHFWYNLSAYVKNSDYLLSRLKSKSIDKLEGAILVSSIGDGVGSGLLPVLLSEFKKRKISSIALALFPSRTQPPDAQFNAFSSLGLCAAKSFAPILMGRDQVESFVGVDRKGSLLTGNNVVSYLLELVLEKEAFTQEIDELSRTFGVKMYGILAATGASLKVYGSLEKMLNASLFTPLFTFDLSTSKVLYVLIRMPIRLKAKLPREKIELDIIKWFKERANLHSVSLSEPIYTADGGDRMDIVMFAGNFDATPIFASIEKQVNENKNRAIESGSIGKKEWQEIANSFKKD